MEQSATRKQKGRSPRYPGIDLETAITRAQQLWDKESHHETNMQTAVGHWGYKPGSGAGAVAVAAMKAFGLLDDAGTGDSRTVRLSETAQNLLLTDDLDEKREIIEHAALLPPAHADLWERYAGHLPSDQSIRHYLIMDRKFTDGGATELVSEYKRTLAFSGLSGRGAMVSVDGPENGEPNAVTTAASDTPLQPVRSHGTSRAGAQPVGPFQIPVPLVDGGVATFTLPREMTEDAWNQMLAVLDALKLALVQRADDSG